MKRRKFRNQREAMESRNREIGVRSRASRARGIAGKTALCLVSALLLSSAGMAAGMSGYSVQAEEEKDTFDTNIYIETDESGISSYTATTKKIEGEYTSVEYPVLQMADGSSSAVIDGINRTFQQDAQMKQSEQEASIKEQYDEIAEYNPDVQMTYDVDCAQIYISGSVYSVLLYDYSYLGGAHGYGYYVGCNYDLLTGRELTMGDLMGCDEATAKEAVVAAYRKNIIGQVENITEESIRGAFDIMEYWMAQDGMHVSIPAYGVASYAAGPQEVTVTAEDVTGGSGDGSEQNAEQPPVSGDSGSDYNAEQPPAGSGETITVIAGIQADASDFIFPYSSTQALTDADLVKLEGSSVEEEHDRSQLAINEILARYGYVFHPENGGSSEEAYNQFNGKAWYEAAKPYCPSTSANEMLYTYITELELSNINVICEWQKVHNCYY